MAIYRVPSHSRLNPLARSHNIFVKPPITVTVDQATETDLAIPVVKIRKIIGANDDITIVDFALTTVVAWTTTSQAITIPATVQRGDVIAFISSWDASTPPSVDITGSSTVTHHWAGGSAPSQHIKTMYAVGSGLDTATLIRPGTGSVNLVVCAIVIRNAIQSVLGPANSTGNVTSNTPNPNSISNTVLGPHRRLFIETYMAAGAAATGAVSTGYTSLASTTVGGSGFGVGYKIERPNSSSTTEDPDAMGTLGSSVPWVTHIFAVAAANINESNTAQTITKLKTKAIGQASETDTAQTIIRFVSTITATVNQATETETAQAITSRKTVPLGRIYESFNRANGSLGANWTTIGVGSEIVSNTAQGPNVDDSYSQYYNANVFYADQTIELDATLGSDPSYVQLFAHSSINLFPAYTFTWSTDTGGTYTLSGLGFTTFSSTGVGITGTRRLKLEVIGATVNAYANGVLISTKATGTSTDLLLGFAQQYNSPGSTSIVDNVFVSPARLLETDLAQAIVVRPKRRLVNQVTESDLAQTILVKATVKQASETDLAQTITHLKTKAIGQVTETDLAQAITPRKIKTLGQTTETDLAQAVTHRKTKTLGQITETDLAQTLTHRKTVHVGPAGSIIEDAEIRFDFPTYANVGATIDTHSGWGPFNATSGITSFVLGDGMLVESDVGPTFSGASMQFAVPTNFLFDSGGMTLISVVDLDAIPTSGYVGAAGVADLSGGTDGTPELGYVWYLYPTHSDLLLFLLDSDIGGSYVVNIGTDPTPEAAVTAAGIHIAVLVIDVAAQEFRVEYHTANEDFDRTIPFDIPVPDFVSNPSQFTRLSVKADFENGTSPDVTIKQFLAWDRPLTQPQIDKAVGYFQETNDLTDTAQPITVNPHRRLVNQTSETETAQSITRRKTVHINETIVSDNFNRTNLAAPGLGANWDAPNYGIVSNQAQRNASAGDYARYLTPIASDMWVEATIPGGLANQDFRVINARSDANLGQNAILAFIRPPDVSGITGAARIGMVQGGVYSDLVSGDAVTQSETFTLRLECIGTTYRLYQNSSLVASVVSAVPTGLGTYAGFNANLPSVVFDNFRAAYAPVSLIETGIAQPITARKTKILGAEYGAVATLINGHSPLLWWRANNAGPGLINSGTGGTTYNATPLSGDPPFYFGAPPVYEGGPNALGGSANAQGFVVASAPEPTLPAGASFTIGCWIDMDAIAARRIPFFASDINEDIFIDFSIKLDGTLLLDVEDADLLALVETVQTVDDGKSHFITATYNGTTGFASIYVDGILDPASNINGDWSSRPISTGINWTFSPYEFRHRDARAGDLFFIDGTALSQAQIQAIYNAGVADPAIEIDLAQPITARKRVTLGQTTETDLAQTITVVQTNNDQTIAVGQASETDLAQAITARKTRTLGQSSETDLAQAVTHLKTKTLGQTTETDLAQSITSRKIKTVNQASETDLAQTITFTSSQSVNQASETDLAQAITSRKTKTLGQTTETDLAQAISVNPQRRLVNQTTETDLAQPITHVKTKILGQTTETDLAQTISVNPKRRLITAASETDVAQSISTATTKNVSVAQTFETDLAQSITVNPKRRLINQTSETDLAQAITFASAQSVNQASETDLAQTITARKTRTLVQTTETDLAQAVTHLKTKTVVQTTETDLAQTISVNPRRRLITAATETDLAQSITANNTIEVAVGQASETDLAQAITVSPKYRLVNRTTETDTSQPITSRKTRSVNQASETDLAQAITARKTKTLGQTAETDLAQTITSRKIKTVNQTSETDLAQTIIVNPKRRLVNQTTETDLAQAIEVIAASLINLASETDLAQTITVSPKRRLVNQTTETDLAQAVTTRKSQSVNQCIETDFAQAMTHYKTRSVTQTIETDLAQTITKRKVKSIAQTTETGLAQSITVRKSVTIGQANESDTAQPLNISDSATVAVSGIGTITTTHRRELFRSASISATGTIAPVGARVVQASTTVSGSATITATKRRIVTKTADVDVTCDITADRTRKLGRGSSVIGTGTLTADRIRVLLRTNTVAGTSSIVFTTPNFIKHFRIIPIDIMPVIVGGHKTIGDTKRRKPG